MMRIVSPQPARAARKRNDCPDCDRCAVVCVSCDPAARESEFGVRRREPTNAHLKPNGTALTGGIFLKGPAFYLLITCPFARESCATCLRSRAGAPTATSSASALHRWPTNVHVLAPLG